MEQLCKRIKFWTVQKKTVMKEVAEKGIYYPDFEKSSFVQENIDLGDLYRFLLFNYNRVNQCDCQGLIFCFMKREGDRITFLNDFDSFQNYIISRRAEIESMWNTFIKADSVIVEIEMETDINPFLIDINNWQLLMPPVILSPPYQESDIYTILELLRNGIVSMGYVDSSLMQAHIPYIKKEDVVAVYPIFNLD